MHLLISAKNIYLSELDVNTVYGVGNNHGYDSIIQTTKRGTQEVYIYAINVGQGNNVLIGQKTVTIGEPLFGSFEICEGGNGEIRVRGWAVNVYNLSSSVEIHAYVGGAAGTTGAEGRSGILCNKERKDVGTVYADYGVGNFRGFDETFKTSKRGESVEVHLYAIGSSNIYLGKKTIKINDPVYYTISYDANGGTGVPSSQQKTHGSALTLSSIEPMRTGYKFLGWSTSSTATIISYVKGASFTTDANTTLYAVWQPSVSPTPSHLPSTPQPTTQPSPMPTENPSSTKTPSPDVNITKKQLIKPRGLKLTARKATWQTVTHNSGYILKIMRGTNVVKTVQIKKGKTSYRIPKNLFKKGKRYRFTLVAQGTGKYKSSKMVKSKILKIK